MCHIVIQKCTTTGIFIKHVILYILEKRNHVRINTPKEINIAGIMTKKADALNGKPGLKSTAMFFLPLVTKNKKRCGVAHYGILF